MVHVVVITVGVVVQEVHGQCAVVVLHSSDGSYHLSGISAVLLRVHHLRQRRNELYSRIDVGVNLCGHGMSSLGLDEYDSVTTSGTI